MFQTLSLLRCLGRIALVVYFLIAAVVLGLRYWILPNIDQWRPAIEQQLSLALDTKVSLDKVAASWKGLNPNLDLKGVEFVGGGQNRVLHVPDIRATLSWRSFFSGSLQFTTLQASGLDINVRRDSRQQLWVLGKSFDLDQASGQSELGLDHPVFVWLAQQRQIILRGSTIKWEDETRDAPPLLLQNVTLRFLSQSNKHSVSLSATPPKELGGQFDMRGEINLVDASVPRTVPQAWAGQLYVHISKMVPRGWTPWVDIPQNLVSGNVSAQWWLAIKDGLPTRFTSDVAVHDGHWMLGTGSNIKAQSARVFLSGPWSAFKRLPMSLEALMDTDTSIASQPSLVPPGHDIEFNIQASAFDLDSKELFSYPLQFDRIAASGHFNSLGKQGFKAAFKGVHLLNEDMDLQLRGSWRQEIAGTTGIADLEGVFKDLSIAAIGEYMPNTVDLDARQWLTSGLVDGHIRNASVMLKGDLDDFPFGTDPTKGDFRIDGRYTGGIIDYLPTVGKELGWPRLTDMDGQVSLHRVDLRLVADKAMIWPTDEAAITLHNVSANIPNIEQGSVLSIQGDTVAQGSTYLALMANSPLGGLLDNAFSETRAQGEWRVPLRLTIPLLHSIDTTVQGTILFDGGSVSLMPEMPPLQHVTGTLGFSDVGLSTSDLKAQFLGGPVAFNGAIGGKQKGLQMQGQMTTKALTQYVGLEGMKRLQGQLKYKGLMQRLKSSKKFVLTLDSDLTGLALDFPKPLGKAAAEPMPLHVQWLPGEHKADMALNIALDNSFRAILLHREDSKKTPYFYAGALGWEQAAVLPAQGVDVDVRYSDVDMESWNRVVDDFTKPLATNKTVRMRPLLPDLHRLRVQSQKTRFLGLTLNQSVLTATQSEPLLWRVDISSPETAGTLFWREASGKVAGRVDAKFNRLAVGELADSSTTPLDLVSTEPADGQAQLEQDEQGLEDYVDIPAINLQVEKFVLYGRSVGRLSVEGVNQERGRMWKLNKLTLTSPSAQLTGSGNWRLNGADRGLTLDAHADISDFGKYLDQLGFKNVLAGGQGTLKGQFVWHNLPWRFKRSDLNGELNINFEKGRFSLLNSRSARLLELLSLQSIRRLATFDINPGSLFSDGFPFDNLTGAVHIEDGVMSSNNYLVVGPAGSINIGGDVDLTTEKLNLQAMVEPNLDFSGATIAAGIAINPIVGVGAFLTQWLLRGPLSKAMAVHYKVSGSWDDPKLNEVESTQLEPAPQNLKDGFSSSANSSGATSSGAPKDASSAPLTTTR